MSLNSCSMKTGFYAIKTRDVDRVRCLSLQDIRSSNEPGDSPTKERLCCLNSGSSQHHMPKGGIAVVVVYSKFVSSIALENNKMCIHNTALRSVVETPFVCQCTEVHYDDVC